MACTASRPIFRIKAAAEGKPRGRIFLADPPGLFSATKDASSDDKLPGTVHNVGMTVRRLKTYAGAQGYVYQYYFVGQRAALADDPEAPATEFVFDVTSDRKLTYAVSVFLAEKVVGAWAARHGRGLTEAEQYAAAKLRLFRAFDELEDVKTDGRRLTIDVQALEEALASLGVD